MRKLTLPTSLVGAGAAAVLGLCLLAPLAQAKEPAPGFTQFAGCPTQTEALRAFCVRADVTGGFLKVGSKNVPIKAPLVLSGGVNEAFEEFAAGPKGGLLPVKQEVPGGIIGLTGLDWLVNYLNLEGLKLFAVTELAGIPTNFTFGTVTLPIKVHLINPILGNSCYIGSTSNPITLHLTTGTTSPPAPNKPITGKEPEFSESGEIFRASNGTYVDNSFSAPGVSGCVLNLFGFIPISINGLVNSQSGLPAPAGTNETVQNFGIQIARQETVYP